jgi:hypothetical protein
MTRPGSPVSLSCAPSSTAGPETIASETGRPEVALRRDGKRAASTAECPGISAKTISCFLPVRVLWPARAGQQGGQAQARRASMAGPRKPAPLPRQAASPPAPQTLTCTTFAGGNPLKWVDDAWL